MLLLPFTALVAAMASAASTPEIPHKKPIKMDFSVLRGNSRSAATKDALPELVKRDGLTELTLNNENTYYAATLKIGSQGAENSVVIDTGSSDLWVMSSGVECSSPSIDNYKRAQVFSEFLDIPERSHRRLMDFEIPNIASGSELNEKRADTTITLKKTVTGLAAEAALQIGGGSSDDDSEIDSGATCTAAGSFNTALLDSFKVNVTAPEFSIHYGDKTYADGFWGHDYVGFGSSNVSDCSFAVVNDTTLDTGVFGIGFAKLETTYSSSSSKYTYENFPLRLKATGQINKVLYSLYLDAADALSGSVLFGAVDHAKYLGKLQTVPIINIYPSYYKTPIRFDIVLDLITLENSSQNVSVLKQPIPALLDSGTTLTYLPSAILSSLVSLLGASLSLVGYYRVSCSYKTNRAYAVFNFSGAEIKVPMSDLILSAGGSTCYLGVKSQLSDRSTGQDYAILGDNFLRNAYVVYDLEDYEISLAQVNYSSSENIEVVLSSVPLAVQAPNYSSTAVASSVTSLSPSSELSSLGLKKSEGTNAIYFAKSMFFAMAGVCMIFVL